MQRLLPNTGRERRCQGIVMHSRLTYCIGQAFSSLIKGSGVKDLKLKCLYKHTEEYNMVSHWSLDSKYRLVLVSV